MKQRGVLLRPSIVKDEAMHRLFMRVAVVIAVLLPVALSPVIVTGQTPIVATPAPGPSFAITVLGVSTLTIPGAGSEGDGEELVHALLSISVEPDAPLPPLTGMRSMVITMQQGRLLVSASGETTRVDVGTGEPIQSGDGGEVICERGECSLEADQPVLLTPGNGLSVTQGAAQMEVRGDDVTVVQISVILPTSVLGGRCWICPGIRP